MCQPSEAQASTTPPPFSLSEQGVDYLVMVTEGVIRPATE